VGVAVSLLVAMGACGDARRIRVPEARSPSAPVAPSEPSPTPTAPGSLEYVFPLRPASDARYTQGHHDYPASDIFAPEGTRFVAVTSGVVEGLSRVDPWDPDVDDPPTRGGLFVSLVGDDGVRYYGSHLASVAPGLDVGDRVEAGELLGHVGDSGNARGIEPHLHFGISRPTHPDDWRVRRGEVDPFPYLEAWRRGRDPTPIVRA
jgi:murein DD-endopeptidase MepM/ murein hydrolase activator NlpD